MKRRCLQQVATTVTKTRNSAVAKRPRDASCHWIFCKVTQDQSRSFEMTLLSKACVKPPSHIWNYVCMSYRFWDIQHKKRGDVETGGRGRSRSLKTAPFNRSYRPMTFYWSAIVSITVRCTMFKLFDAESSWLWKGHWMSFKLVPFESFYLHYLHLFAFLFYFGGFLFAFHSNYGRIFNGLWNI